MFTERSRETTPRTKDVVTVIRGLGMMVSGLYLVETTLVHDEGVVVAHEDNRNDETLFAGLGDDFCSV